MDSAPPGAPRTPVVYDSTAGALRIGPYERRLDDPESPDEVYGAYLSLLYAVRSAEPGDRLPLRSADLEALLLLVGDDPATIESRLVELMGCTPEEAGLLARVLLRHRRMTATLGIAAGLSLAGVGLASQLPDDSPERAPQAIASAPAPQAVSVGPVAPSAAPAAPAVTPSQPAPVAPTSVVVAQPVVVGPVAAPAPVVGPPVVDVPVVEVPVVEVPVVEVPVVEVPVAGPVVPPAPAPVDPPVDPLTVLPTFAEPVLDAPPPVEDQPDSDIGEPAVLEPGSEEIGGVVDHGTGHGAPPEVLPEVDGLEPPVSDTATAAIG